MRYFLSATRVNHERDLNVQLVCYSLRVFKLEFEFLLSFYWVRDIKRFLS